VGHAYSFYSIATDLTGNLEAAKASAEASTSVTSGGSCGPASLSAQLLNVVHAGTTVTANLQLTNTGFAAAQVVNINQVTLRTLSGTGTVTLSSPTLPLAVGSLAIGATTTVPVAFNVPSTVARFSVTEGGTIKDAPGNSYSFSMAQTIIP
jgi:D-serine deaminase-like pyridoxal phosphate-dependent protein